MTRVTNLASQNLSLALLQQTQSRVMDEQVQISTGKKAERYMGVAPDAARLVSVKADHARVTQFVAGNEIVDLRLKRMESSITWVMDVATNLRTLLGNATQGSNPSAYTITATDSTKYHQVDTTARQYGGKIECKSL